MFKKTIVYFGIIAFLTLGFVAKAEGVMENKDYCTGVVDLSGNCLGGHWVSTNTCNGILLQTLSGPICIPRGRE